jgi:hypothetical protein
MPSDRSPEAARKRLEDAHRLWHQALESYPDADAFVTNVNALISGLRTVTWVLQASFKRVAGFEAWYAPVQREMRDDAVMRWAVEARNRIEKVGDLELQSTARVSVIASWHLPPAYEFEVPPLASPHEIAMLLAARSVPAHLRDKGVMRVERRWVTVGLPDREILDACAYVYSTLARIVRDAEQRFARGKARGLDPTPLGMDAGPQARSAILHLESGKFLSLAVRYEETVEGEADEVEARYGDMLRSIPRPDGTFAGRVKWHHAAARGMFLRDAGHITVAFLYRYGHRIGIVQVEAEDQQEKYILLEDLARQAAATGADEVILTAESWSASMLPASDPDAALRPSERKDRGESVLTQGITRDGLATTLVSPVRRMGERIELGEVAEATDSWPLTLMPTWRAWHGAHAPPPWDRTEPR